MLEYPKVMDLETCCHLCGGPLVNGQCEAYHWHDQVHLAKRARIREKNTFRVSRITSVGELEDFLKNS
jgi:hypothetical protein